MGHVFHAPQIFSSCARYSVSDIDPLSGVSYRDAPDNNGKLEEMRNLWLRGGIAVSRPSFEALTEGLSGSLHNSVSFCRSLLLHVGTVLYRLHDGALSTLVEGLPDENSVTVEFSGKLYLYSGARIFCVDRTLSAVEVFPSAPIVGKSCDSNSGIYRSISDSTLNLLAPYVAVTYSVPDAQFLYKGYRFPSDMDTERPFEIFFEDERVDESEYTFDERYWKFTERKQTEEETVKLCYYSTKKEYAELGKKLAACTVGTAFGGGTLEGTRVFLAGNPEYPGSYFTSSLGDPLCFVENSGGTLGESTGDITGFAKQNGDLLIFTESTLTRMSYHYLSDSGGYYSLKTIHASVGCDMPESIASADNRTVFAHSAHGVCLVDSMEWYDGMNVVNISRSIEAPSRQRGFFAEDAAKLKRATSCVYDRKYILCVGEKAFVWDFGETPYTSSSDAEKAAARLAWFSFDGLDGRLCTDTQTLYALMTDEESCVPKKAAESGKKTAFLLHSGERVLAKPHTAKSVIGLAFSARSEKPTALTLTVYADGKSYHRQSLRVEPKENGLASVYVSLPRRSAERFAFALSGEDAGVGLFDFRLDYILLKKQKYRR